MMPDGETLVIAIGGIRTHPDSGRQSLNPDSLAPSLIYLNRHSGQMIDQRDCAGIASLSSNKLAVSNGPGEIQVLQCFRGMAKSIHRVKHADCRWDNHMLSIQPPA